MHQQSVALASCTIAHWLGLLHKGQMEAAADGVGRQAIVVSADIAEYALGSTGEPTQGAGAVAMLVESEAKLLEVFLIECGHF